MTRSAPTSAAAAQNRRRRRSLSPASRSQGCSCRRAAHTLGSCRKQPAAAGQGHPGCCRKEIAAGRWRPGFYWRKQLAYADLWRPGGCGSRKGTLSDWQETLQEPWGRAGPSILPARRRTAQLKTRTNFQTTKNAMEKYRSQNGRGAWINLRVGDL